MIQALYYDIVCNKVIIRSCIIDSEMPYFLVWSLSSSAWCIMLGCSSDSICTRAQWPLLRGWETTRWGGVTIVPWKSGRSLVWDATYSDTFAPSNIQHAVREARAVAVEAEHRKRAKYQVLTHTHTHSLGGDIWCLWP